METFDGIKKFGFKISEDHGKYILTANSWDWTNAIETFEITKGEAEDIMAAYAPLAGKEIDDLCGPESGKKSLGKAADIYKRIVFHYRNKREGLT